MKSGAEVAAVRARYGGSLGIMESFKLVRPEHLNHYGYLFGGTLLKWVDEAAWISASLDHPGCKFVTVGMDKVEFRKSVKQGSILTLNVQKGKVGNTSVQYTVNVFSDDIETGRKETIFSTNITFVCLDDAGRKCTIPGNPECKPLQSPSA